MNNTLALVLGAMIAVFLAVDFMVFDWANTIFLGRKLFWLIDYIAFWR
ncbi:hypothetical protein [Sagittula sp. S175]